MNNLRGGLLMVAAMGFFAVEDALIKWASANLPVGQMVMIIALAGMALFSVIVLARGERLVPRELFGRVMIIRNLSEAVGVMFFVTALTLIPLSATSAIFQATPLAVTMLAALFLREPVGWRRWVAIAVGFAGVLCIIRPGTEAFDPAALLALGAVLAVALRDLTTRIAPQTMTTTEISLWAYPFLVPTGALLLLLSGEDVVPVPVPTLGLIGAIVLTGMAGYLILVMSLRMSDLSAVAPFRYSRLVFAMLLGAMIFGERPDALTLLGTALIVASGLYTFARERALFRAAAEG